MIKYKVVTETPGEMTAVDPHGSLWLSWVKWVESGDYLKAKRLLEGSEAEDLYDDALWVAFCAGYVASEHEHAVDKQKLIDQNLPATLDIPKFLRKNDD